MLGHSRARGRRNAPIWRVIHGRGGRGTGHLKSEGGEVALEAGEEIRTEISAKFTPERVELELGEAGLRLEDVAGWAVHPGGPRILDVVRDELGLTEDEIAASRRVLAEHGNCSSATVLLVLEEMAEVDGPVVVMAFGPGLTLYAALLLPA